MRTRVHLPRSSSRYDVGGESLASSRESGVGSCESAWQPLLPQFDHEAARLLADCPTLGALTGAEEAVAASRTGGDEIIGWIEGDELVAVYRERILPRTTVLTPNALELRRLAPDCDDTQSRCAALLEHGPRWVLAKGGDEATANVENFLYGRDGEHGTWTWERLDGEHHGSGCTLAASIAAQLAHGDAVPRAVELAQQFTFDALAGGWRLGRGQRIPNRQCR